MDALRELAAREVESERLADALLRARAALQELGDSRNLLFTEHSKMRSEFASEKAALVEKARMSEGEALEARKQLETVSDLVERLKSAPPEALRNDLVAATRKMAMLQVKEIRLQRALEAATAGEQLAKADKEEAMRDLEEVSEVARSRISGLERERSAAKGREDRLAQQLQQSVPRREVESVRDELRSLQAMHRVQLEESTTRVLQDGEFRRAVDEASMARARAAAAEAETAALRSRCRLLEAELAKPAAGGDAVLAQLRSERVVLQVDLESANLTVAHHRSERERAEEGKAELLECAPGKSSDPTPLDPYFVSAPRACSEPAARTEKLPPPSASPPAIASVVPAAACRRSRPALRSSPTPPKPRTSPSANCARNSTPRCSSQSTRSA